MRALVIQLRVMSFCFCNKRQIEVLHVCISEPVAVILNTGLCVPKAQL
jgi:hypothetical protein